MSSLNAKQTMMNIQKIRLIRKCLTRDICHQLTLSLAIPHLDYSNAILIGCPEYHTKPNAEGAEHSSKNDTK